MDEKYSFDDMKRQVVSYLEKIGANKKFIEGIKRTDNEYRIYVLGCNDCETIKEWEKGHDLSDYIECIDMDWAATL